MSSRTTFDIVHGIFTDQWTATPIYFENEYRDLEATPDHFVFVECYGNFWEQESIGASPNTSNRWREEGQIDAHVLTPRGMGSAQARGYAEAICEIFRGQEIQGIRFRDMSIGSSQNGDDDGNYWRMTATIEWQRDKDV
jgi:hypothetical protein